MERDEAVDGLFQDFSALVQRLRGAKAQTQDAVTSVRTDVSLAEIGGSGVRCVDPGR